MNRTNEGKGYFVGDEVNGTVEEIKPKTISEAREGMY